MRVIFVDRRPDIGIEPLLVDLFWALAAAGLLFVAIERRQPAPVQVEPLLLRDLPPPADGHIHGVRIERESAWFGILPVQLRFKVEVLPGVVKRDPGGDLFW